MKALKNKAVSVFAVLVALLGFSSLANAALDFTGITTAASDAVPAVTAAIGLVAGVKLLPGLAKWGFNKVIGWFR